MPEEKHFWDETRKPWMDLEGERRVVKPQKSAKSHARANENTGKASQLMAGFFQDMVMQEVIRDVQDAHETPCCDLPHNKEDFNANLHSNGPTTINDPDTLNGPDELDDYEDSLESIRQKRLIELMKNSTNKNKYLSLGHGKYTEIFETEFLKTVTESPRSVVHFYHSQFKRCAAMDQHLCKLAPVLLGCRLVKLNAEKAPFFVGKLKVKVLPTLVFFVNGVAKQRIVGFEGLMDGEDNENFPTTALVRVLEGEGMLVDSDEAAVNRVAEEDGQTVTKEVVGDEEEEW